MMVDMMPLDEMTVDMSLDEMTLDMMSLDEMTADKMTGRCILQVVSHGLTRPSSRSYKTFWNGYFVFYPGFEPLIARAAVECSTTALVPLSFAVLYR
jgi:hypothetical protein